ncbi:MAG: protein-L-isoaspartate(D-aspartate) O-methyltransferase [Rhizobiaceae bacterium]
MTAREALAAFLMRMRAGGIADNALLAAFETVPRARFLPTEWASHAYSARMIPIACGEAIEGADYQASTIAALDIKGSERVLEVGTGSGYTAAIMAQLGARVVSLERYKTLCTDAQHRLEGLAPVSVRHADGSKGMASEGPFDRVIAWAAFETLPRQFTDQIASGGIMIAPIGGAEERQTLVKLTKIGSRFERENIGFARLQPLAQSIAARL